jgi:antitoxin FitA
VHGFPYRRIRALLTRADCDITFLDRDIISEGPVAQIIIRRLDDTVKEQLRERARRHGRSLEAEVRAILEAAAPVDTAPRRDEKGFGTLMHELFGKVGFTESERRAFDRAIEAMRSSGTLQVPDFE